VQRVESWVSAEGGRGAVRAWIALVVRDGGQGRRRRREKGGERSPPAAATIFCIGPKQRERQPRSDPRISLRQSKPAPSAAGCHMGLSE
jgi:hypothetical protein